MKALMLLVLLLELANPAFGQSLPANNSFFHLEAGLGAQLSKDLGDGAWVQYGMPHSETLAGPAFMAGVVMTPTTWLAFHVDYVYLGAVTATTLAVPDAAYNPHTHTAQPVPPQEMAMFNGAGVTQGIAMTVEPSYSFGALKASVEFGPTVLWPTWHESITPLGGVPFEVQHNAVAQFSYVAGAALYYKSWGLSYRYYPTRSKWNPYPSLTENVQTLMITYRW